MANLKLTKFQQVAEAPIFIRKEYLNSKCIAFGLPGDLLSVIQDEVDFDAESERILKEPEISKNQTMRGRMSPLYSIDNA